MNKIQEFVKSPITKRISFTIMILIIYRALFFVTIPGVNSAALAKLSNNSSLTMLSMFSGGGFENFSIMSLGVTAYIIAQIIVQLLQADVIPTLTQWSKEGQTGRKKLDKVTRSLTLVLGLVQATGITLGINTLTNGKFMIENNPFTIIVIAMLMTAGSFIAMWLGDLITENGLGNGISVIITAGILVRFPSMINDVIEGVTFGTKVNWIRFSELMIGAAILILLIVWFTRSELRIPIQYARRAQLTGKDSYLPLKIIVPGVIPIIFASTIMTIPQTILMFFNAGQNSSWYRVVQTFFTLSTTSGVIIYGLMIIFFEYLYSIVQIEPDKFADNLEKQEAYIPNVYPGDPTKEFIQNMLNYLSLPGSLFLMWVSIIPLLVANSVSSSLQIGLSGSSILIITGVLIEIGRQIKGLKLKRKYGTFLSTDFSLDD
ncbi:preprotein translocase subunit SecY [Lactobacillus crispatus]|uniref:Protein translocase subunit SecY n=2 Tax=Lactobacillus crispatus TaxID=47770 RepID=K1MHT8_9LACO|nr:preprotein translocase subunit SecY [Lactobacillus crispatus]EKB62018.1 preprotein translocase, SecY subunit [Lactobacillus crispatus FB077-07]